MSKHAFLADSSNGCTVNCAAAPRLQSFFPEPENEDTKAGDASHWAGACMLTSQSIKIGSLAPNGVIVDAEMFEGAEMWADNVIYSLSAFPQPWQEGLHVEERIVNDALHPTHNFGTPDSWAVRAMAGALQTVFLDDYKFGHAVVDVFENWQLIGYAAKICQAIGLNGLDDQNTYFQFRIIQPRAYHRDGPVRTWTIKASDLRPYFNRLRSRFAEAVGPNPLATPGRWCKTQYCSAAHACEALQRAVGHVADEAYIGRADVLTPADVGIELYHLERAKAMLDARVDGLREQAKMLIEAGESVPNFVLQRGKGRRIVPDHLVAQFIMAGDVFGKDLRKPLKAITPLQAIAKNVPEEALAPFIENQPGEAKLTLDSELQPARIFGA